MESSTNLVSGIWSTNGISYAGFGSIDVEIDSVTNRLSTEGYPERFMRLRETAFTNPKSFFNRYSVLSEDAGYAIAQGLWDNINLINLHQNILPTRPRADLVLRKGPDHLIEHVALRKL